MDIRCLILRYRYEFRDEFCHILPNRYGIFHAVIQEERMTMLKHRILYLRQERLPMMKIYEFIVSQIVLLLRRNSQVFTETTE